MVKVTRTVLATAWKQNTVMFIHFNDAHTQPYTLTVACIISAFAACAAIGAVTAASTAIQQSI